MLPTPFRSDQREQEKGQCKPFVTVYTKICPQIIADDSTSVLSSPSHYLDPFSGIKLEIHPCPIPIKKTSSIKTDLFYLYWSNFRFLGWAVRKCRAILTLTYLRVTELPHHRKVTELPHHRRVTELLRTGRYQNCPQFRGVWGSDPSVMGLLWDPS